MTVFPSLFPLAILTALTLTLGCSTNVETITDAPPAEPARSEHDDGSLSEGAVAILREDPVGQHEEAANSRLSPSANSRLASGCSNYSTRWVSDGCCTKTATRRKQQVCIYGTWYSLNKTECRSSTSDCL